MSISVSRRSVGKFLHVDLSQRAPADDEGKLSGGGGGPANHPTPRLCPREAFAPVCRTSLALANPESK